MKKLTIPLAVFGVALGAIYVSSTTWNQPRQNIHNQDDYVKAAADSEILGLQSLLKITNNADRDRRIEEFFIHYMQNNPDGALKMISELNRFEDRLASYTVALQVWSELDFPSFSNWLERKNPDLELDTALINLIDNSSSELTLSLLYAEKIFDQKTRNTELSELINKWVLIDPEQLILWTIAPGTDRNSWLAMTFEILSINSSTSAISSLSFLESGSTDQLHLAIQTIINNYQLGQGIQDSLSAMQALTPYEIREEFIGAVLPVLVFEEGLSVDDLDYLLSSLFPGDVKDSYHEKVAQNWAFRDPYEAAGYAESLTGDIRHRAVNAVVTSWMQDDLESTDAWLKTLDGDLDLAANTLGRGSAELGNIEIADTWLNHIENVEIRTEAIIDAIRGWYNEDPKAGIYHLVFQENLTTQQKLSFLHEIYPEEVFMSPNEALDNIGRLESLTPAF